MACDKYEIDLMIMLTYSREISLAYRPNNPPIPSDVYLDGQFLPVPSVMSIMLEKAIVPSHA